jgi:hypothetical protein
MPVWEIVVICFIPLYGWGVFFLLSPLVDFLQRRAKANACYKSEQFVSFKVGYVNYFCGPVGIGKSTCASGFVNLLSKVLSDKAKAKVIEVQGIFPNLDFNDVNSVISMAFNQAHITNSDMILDFLCEHLEGFNDLLQGKFYNNYLFPQSLYSVFRDYIDAYLAVLRNRYVYFNRQAFYCWVTDTWAMDYFPDMVDLNNRRIKKDYRVMRYSIIFEDEKTLDKKSTDFASVAKNKAGADKFYRLIRHLGRGSQYYVCTAQDFNRVVKEERELATGVFSIMQRKELPLMSLKEILVSFGLDFLLRFQVFYLGICNSFYSARLSSLSKKLEAIKKAGLKPSKGFVDKITALSKAPSLKASRLRGLVSKLQSVQKSFFADEYISYKGLWYTNSDDVGKSPKDCVSPCWKIDLVFPLSWCYGSIDTYSFSCVGDYLSKMSKNCRDYYNPDDHRIPYESDEDYYRYLDSVLSKDGFGSGADYEPSSSSDW